MSYESENLEMKKSRRNVKQTRVECDRLSELPDSLILCILELLPMRDVVRTTILSKRWESLWTTVSCLNFDDSMKAGLVERALKSWRGVKILKFKINFPLTCCRSLTSRDVDSWVRFAMDHQVQELSIHLYLISVSSWSREAYCVPQDLYSCSLLKELTLKYVDLILMVMCACSEWNQLKSLTIHGTRLDGKTISRILCGSPQLEILHFSLRESNDNFIIRSSTLKRLSIKSTLYPRMEGSSELVIWTPNLETLEMSGIPHPKCLLMDVSSLTHATLGYYFGDYGLRQILPKIQHVERLTLVGFCIKALVALKKEFLASPFPKVNLLQLKDFDEFEPVVGVLEMLSTVKTLVLQPNNIASIRSRHARSNFQVERDLPKSFLQQTVEVTWINGDNSIYPLVEFVLKYASQLEKMVFREKRLIRISTLWKSLFLELRRLQRMPRSSPNAELIFCEY